MSMLDISARDVLVNDETEELIRYSFQTRYNLRTDHRLPGLGSTSLTAADTNRDDLHNVSIDITVPGGELVIKRESDQDLRGRHVSFETAQRRLKNYTERQRGGENSYLPGRGVVRIFTEEGYGFSLTPEGREVYFHEIRCPGREIEALNIGTESDL